MSTIKINTIVLIASLWAGAGSATPIIQPVIQPIIQEVFYDALGPDRSSVFTELYGIPGTSLAGWTLVGVNGANGKPYRTLDLTGAVIPMDGLLVIATVSTIGTLLAVRDFVANVDWQNGPDAVLLYDPFGGLADALQYGSAGTHNSGAGAPAPDPPAGLGLTRDALSTDTGDNARDFFASPPTPGFRAAPVPVSEPNVFGLVLLAASALLRRPGRAERAARSF